MKKFVLAAALALAATPLAVAGLAGAKPANPQGGSGSAQCGDAESTVNWTPTNLWPPNHKPRTINITYIESPSDGGTHSIDIGQITEFPVNTDVNGAGHTSSDSTGSGSTGATVDDGTPAVPSQPVTLLAERSGHDMAGRTYAIPVTCHNDDEQDQTIVICVTTPHDQHHAVVQDPNADCAATIATG